MCVETKLDRFLGILLSGQLPPIIRPIVGLLLILPFRICKARVKKVLTPIVKQRMHEVACEQDDATMRNESQDFLTQSVRVIMKDKEIAHQSAEYVADQFLILVSPRPLTSGNAQTYHSLTV